MDLGLSGRLPKIFTKEDLVWLRNYLHEHGESPHDRPQRKHMSNFHRNVWDPINNLLMERFYPVIGEDFTFRIALANIKYKNDDAIHTDICFLYSALPLGMRAPIEDENQIFYTFLIVEDYQHEYGNYKPSTYIFENSSSDFNKSSLSYDANSVIDASWPTYEVSKKTERELAQYPISILEKFKILTVLDQDPLSVNYWLSNQYHTQDAFSNMGVKWKKYFTLVASKKI